MLALAASLEAGEVLGEKNKNEIKVMICDVCVKGKDSLCRNLLISFIEENVVYSLATAEV